jgi:3-oxoacyl-[acyl-carrier protein] reductase
MRAPAGQEPVWPIYPGLAGKIAVVTGGSRGLGAAACRALAADGVKVAVNGRDRSAVEGVVREIGDAGRRAIAAPADCSNSSALAQMGRRVEEELGGVDLLLVFAGGGRQPQPVAQITDPNATLS